MKRAACTVQLGAYNLLLTDARSNTHANVEAPEQYILWVDLHPAASEHYMRQIYVCMRVRVRARVRVRVRVRVRACVCVCVRVRACTCMGGMHVYGPRV